MLYKIIIYGIDLCETKEMKVFDFELNFKTLVQ